MYSVSRKNCEKIAPPINRPLTFDAVSVRRRKMRSGRSGAASRGRAPDPEREVPLTSFAEGRRQDREGGRREQRRSEALQRAEGDQRARRPGEPVEQRAHGEEGEAGHEEPSPAEQVGE